MSAEISLQNPPILRAVEDRAPCFKLANTIGRFFRVQLGHAPLVNILPTAHGVGEMHFPIVAVIDIGQCSRNAAFGHYRVRFAKKGFANQTN